MEEEIKNLKEALAKANNANAELNNTVLFLKNQCESSQNTINKLFASNTILQNNFDMMKSREKASHKFSDDSKNY